MAHYQTDDRAKLRKHWVEQAISLAMKSKWEEAVTVNRTIIDLFPGDVDAYNRLGRALTELGRYKEAKEAYQKAVEIDPNNGIAQKNLARLSNLSVEHAAGASEKIDPHLFIAETGKTGTAMLVRTADKSVLAKMTVGDQVYLNPEGRALLVRNSRGDVLGQVEPRIGQRLIDLIHGGNRYAAALVSLEDTNAKVIIREVHQDPSQAGKVSFPSKGETGAIRPYIKETLLKYELEDEELPEEEEEESEFGLEAESEEGFEEVEYEAEGQVAE